ncbi:type IV pilus assembly protein TapC [Geobacter sp. OR-1]|uniref:type II secretion system F family protein n=1 Tax=Geobacter sp. OR-1 TaxID=1266765 RepID=UPI000541D98E|nr:type II secretion system F family protein [Geobacter sp. OR-1]GAM08230.1 type IV pilus assembly protein TapC [Geobacter sp. OR-1]
MNRYSYEGLNKNGDKVSGTMFGIKEDLVNEIRDKGIILTSIKEDRKSMRRGRYTLKDFKNNSEELYHLVSAGIKLDQAIATLIKNTRKQSVHDFWEGTLARIKEGHQFSAALRSGFDQHGFGGGELYINILAVGEEIGDLKNAFKNLLEYLEFKFSLIKEIKSAISYPLFLVAMSMVTVVIVCGFILPRFAKIFTAAELAKLPAISKLTIGYGKFLNAHFPLITLVGVAVIGVIIWLASTPAFVKRFKKWAYTLPLVGDYMLLSDLANLFSSLGSMLGGGVDVSRALKLSAAVVGSEKLINLLSETNDEVRKGHRISQVWSSNDMMPEDAVSLVVVGENSARMGEIFETLGKRYLDNFKTGIARALGLLEPLIIVFVGFFIALVVISIMLSVVSLGDVAL